MRCRRPPGELGMAEADRSAAWLPREHAEARTTRPRSISLRAPPFASWSDPPFLLFPRPPFVPVKYRGPNAWQLESRCSIPTTTRHILTLQPDNQRSFCPRSLELTEDNHEHRRDRGVPLKCSFRGSHHNTMNSNEWPSFPWFSPRHYEHPPRHVRTRRAICD